MAPFKFGKKLSRDRKNSASSKSNHSNTAADPVYFDSFTDQHYNADSSGNNVKLNPVSPTDPAKNFTVVSPQLYPNTQQAQGSAQPPQGVHYQQWSNPRVQPTPTPADQRNISGATSHSIPNEESQNTNMMSPTLNTNDESNNNSQLNSSQQRQYQQYSQQPGMQQRKYTPWNRVRLSNSPFPRYRHVASSYATSDDRIFVIGGLHDQSVYGDTWVIKSEANGTRFSSQTVDITENTPPPRVGHAATLCGNAFVVFGGDTHKVNADGMMDDDLYLFNINSYKWTIPHPVGTRPLGRYGHEIAVIATTQMRTRLYLFGGQFDDTYFNDLHVFDLSSFRRPNSHWELVKPKSFTPPPITNHTMVSYDYKLWVFGGDTLQGLVNKVFMYDPTINNWMIIEATNSTKEELEAIPPPMHEHAAVVYKDLMCVVGGKDQDDTYLNSVYFFNFKSRKWFKLPFFKVGIPQGRSGHSVTLLKNNKLLIMGGDKFDYARTDENDLHTSEYDMGKGTILYTLDLTNLEEFCPGIFNSEVKGTTRAEEKPGTSKTLGVPTTGTSFNPTTPPLNGTSSLPGTSGVGTGPGYELQNPNILTPYNPIADNQYTPGHNDIERPYTTGNTTAAGIDSVLKQDIEDLNKPPEEIGRVANGQQPVEDFSNSKSSVTPEVARELPEGKLNEPVQLKKMEVDGLGVTKNGGQEESPSGIRSPINEKSSVPAVSNIKEKDEDGVLGSEDSNDTRKLLQDLQSQLKQLKAAANGKAVEASNQISSLETELQQLKVTSGKGDVPPQGDIVVKKLQNRCDILEGDNKALKVRLVGLEKLLNAKFLDLSNLNNIIKQQREVIEKYGPSSESGSQIDELKGKIEALTSENERLKKDLKDRESSDIQNIKEYSEDIDIFIGKWNNSVKVSEAHEGDQGSEEDVNTKDLAAYNPYHRTVIKKLNQQLDDLLSKSQELSESRDKLGVEYRLLEEKYSKASEELRAKQTELDELSANYKESINSMNNTSKALELSQKELERYKSLNKKLQEDLENVKLGHDRDGGSEGKEDGNISVNSNDNSSIRDARFNMKINDLKAELFIIQQERDSLKDETLQLKKKLLKFENPGLEE